MTKIIRIAVVEDRTGLKRPTIYRRMGEGTFPRQIQLGPNSVGWDEAEIDAWLADRPRGPLAEPRAGEVRRFKLAAAGSPDGTMVASPNLPDRSPKHREDNND